MTRIAITEVFVKAAADLLAKDAKRSRGRLHTDVRSRLKAIADGTRKLIDVDWWREVHGPQYIHWPDLRDTVDNRAKLEKLKALADPKRNPNEHERKAAEAKLASFKPKTPPSAPGLEAFDREIERRREIARKQSEAMQRLIREKMQKMREAEQSAKEGANAGKRKAAARKILTTDSVAPTRPATDTVARAAKEGAKRKATPDHATDSVADHVSHNTLYGAAGKAQGHPTDSVSERKKAPTAKRQAAPGHATDSVAGASLRNETNSVAEGWLARRTAKRAAARAQLKCRTCGKPLAAQRPTARFCGPTCRSKAWRAR
jgi:hypothetical protein